ncbi:tyrosine-type recombinase/integrase [Autumnicola psychrophila]|uniref:Tyrosine-type recombinase/integrase n=1 Tax=Autumnicola psychrophila TaxID=3075592 RepID=A0ABU3DPG4_9FLAO|nr:tyrosine-type recombinase/integrase [Zunongwangia sp. F225]MDT0685590.1 tyrosine-type recombinase/integrase [Zunongwangia sp. F225]
MSTTHKIVLIKKYAKDKEGYLKLRTTKDRKPTYTPLGFKVQVSNWNADKQYVKSKEPNSDRINEKIQEVKAEAQYNTVKKKKEVKGKSFVRYAKKVIQVISQEGTKRSRNNGLNKLRDFLKIKDKDDIAFEDIDTFFVKEYYGYLLENVANSSANEYLTVFKYFLTHADAHGYHSYTISPFRGLKKKKEKRSLPVLKYYEVEKFFGYKPEKEDFYLVQQAFGFMMYASGMRVSDFVTLKWKNFKEINGNYYVEFNMNKTKTLMKTKLTLDALQFLIPFMELYDKSAVNSFRIFEKKQKNMRKKLKEAIDEESQIELRSFSEFKYDIFADLMDKWHTLVEQESKKEERKITLQQLIEGMKRDLIFNEDILLSILGNQIIEFKDKYPEDTVHPMLRDGQSYSEAQNAKQHFNYRLRIMGKECDIKTPVTNHQARHVFAQRLFEAGANFHHVSLALGHSSLEITEHYREKLVTDDAMDVVEEFSRIMTKTI